MRRPAAILIALTTLSACSGGARVADLPPPLPPPSRPVRPVPPPPPPPPIAVLAAPVEVVPVPEPRAPRGTVQTRTYYAEADVTEWVLTNGATVVFKPLSNGGEVLALGMVPSTESQTCEQRVYGLAPSGDLSSLFSASLGSRAVYVVVGDARPGEVEQAAARLLTLTPESGRCTALGVVSIGTMHAYVATVPDGGDATLAVLADLLRQGGTTRVSSGEAPAGTAVLGMEGSAATLSALRPTEAQMSAARADATRRAGTGGFWTDALADLYRPDGDLRPSRDPSVVARFPARVARVSSRAVTDLAARFAASPAASPAN